MHPRPFRCGARGAGAALVALLLLALPATAARSAPDRAAPLLGFELRDRAGVPRGWLLGTVHVGRPGEAVLDPRVEALLERSDALVVELDLLALEPQRTAQLLAERGALPPGVTLADRVSSSTLGELLAALDRRGLPRRAFLAAEPWMVALALQEQLFRESGFVPEQGVDRALLERARGRVPVIPLETLEEQVGLLDGLPREVQELMLREVLLQAGETNRVLGELMAAWRAGDARALEAAVFRDLVRHPELAPFYERTFFARNRRFAAALRELLRRSDGRLLVAVGAGHLVGGRGLVALLRGAGFELRQIGARDR